MEAYLLTGIDWTITLILKSPHFGTCENISQIMNKFPFDAFGLLESFGESGFQCPDPSKIDPTQQVNILFEKLNKVYK